MTDDIFGFARFAQHRHWRCEGRIEARADDVIDPIEPRSFTVERCGDRWLLSGEDGLISVGDGIRDLVPEHGGLTRRPAPSSFQPYWSANLLRQIGDLFPREFVIEAKIAAQRHETMNGRPTRVLELEHPEAGSFTLGIDTESGIWVSLVAPVLTLTVDDLLLNPSAATAFQLLDMVPEISWSDHPESVDVELVPVLDLVRQATDSSVEVLSQDSETREFHLLLRAPGGEPIGTVSRSRTILFIPAAVFPGGQASAGGPDWQYRVDLAFGDSRSASLLLRDLMKAWP